MLKTKTGCDHFLGSSPQMVLQLGSQTQKLIETSQNTKNGLLFTKPAAFLTSSIEDRIMLLLTDELNNGGKFILLINE